MLPLQFLNQMGRVLIAAWFSRRKEDVHANPSATLLVRKRRFRPTRVGGAVDCVNTAIGVLAPTTAPASYPAGRGFNPIASRTKAIVS